MNFSNFIKEAFYILSASTAPEKISVNDIIKKAGVNRSTFYYYYQNKDDLMKQLQNELLTTFFNILKYEDTHKKLIIENFGHLESPQVHACCKYVQLNKKTFQYWFNNSDFIDSFFEKLMQYMKKFSRNETHCIYAAYGAIGHFRHWLQTDCKECSSEITYAILELFQHSFTLQKDS